MQGGIAKVNIGIKMEVKKKRLIPKILKARNREEKPTKQRENI